MYRSGALVLSAVVSFGLASETVIAEQLYWSLGDRIARTNPDGSDFRLIVADLCKRPTALVVDPTDGTLYWHDEGTIYSQSVGFDNVKIIATAEALDIAVDSEHGYLFWIDGEGIRRSSLTGADNTALIPDVVAMHLAIDSAGDKLYWSTPSRIRRANFDGTSIEEILEIGGANGLAIHTGFQKLYWSDPGSTEDSLLRANLDGSDIEEILLDQFDSGLAIDNIANKIVWVSPFGPPERHVMKANLDGSDDQIISYTGNFVHDITTDPIRNAVIWTSECYGSCSTDNETIRARRLNGSPYDVYGCQIGPEVEVSNFWQVDNQSGVIRWRDVVSSPTDQCKIRSANFDGSNATTTHTFAPFANYATWFAYNPNTQAIYYSAPFSPPRLHGPNLNIQTTTPVTSLSLDHVNDRLYWTVGGNVCRNVSDTDFEVIVNAAGAYKVWVDSADAQIFWVNSQGVTRADLDGSSAELILPLPTGAQRILVEPAVGKIYWTFSSMLYRADLTGSNTEPLMVPQGTLMGARLVPSIIASTPPHGAIDARQPHDPNDSMLKVGWSTVDVQFDNLTNGLTQDEYEVTEIGGDQLVPAFSVEDIAPSSQRVTFAGSIEPRAWTCIKHTTSATQVCLGYLPADVSGDARSSPVDILKLIDNLNGLLDPPYQVWSSDIDRSGTPNPPDILRLIDLLNGAGQFEPWLGAELPESP